MQFKTDADPEVLRRYQELKERERELQVRESRQSLLDPVTWASDRTGTFLWSKQRDIIESVRDNPRTAVKSCHAAGKSRVAAVIAAWWIESHPPGTAMVVTTAPSYEQVHGVLWEEIRAIDLSHGLRGTIQRSDRWLDTDGKILGYGRRPPDHSQSAFQGTHRQFVLVVVDEAGGVPAWLWTSIDAITTGEDCKILAIGNPDDNASHFASICDSTQWNTIQISAFDTPAFTGEDVPEILRNGQVLISRAWVEDKRIRWGEDNPLYIAKVLGQFADAEGSLIPLSWITAAQARWHAWDDAGRPHQPGPLRYGVDVARFGEDKTAIAHRSGDVIIEVELHAKDDTVVTADRVDRYLEVHPQYTARIDTIGIGSGVYDQLNNRHRNVSSFVASARTNMRDRTGTLKFRNVRSASWWHMRELLDPANDSTIALPPDDQLAAELSTPHWVELAGGIIGVEEKDQIRRRLGRSTDSADAVIMVFWQQATEVVDSLGRQTPKDERKRRKSSTDWSHLS